MTRKIITRAEAKARGLKRYFTGKPCRQGHISERGVAHPGCIECGRLNSARYKKENPEKYKEARRRTHLRHREKNIAVGKEWYRKNKATHRARHKEWAQKHVEKMRLYSRKYYQSNLEKEKRRRRSIYWKDPEKQRERVQRYRYEGPINPKGDSQWLSKARASLRSLNRLLKPRHPARSSLRKRAQKA